MKASIGHIGINLSNSTVSFKFWKRLLQFLEFRIFEETDWHFDATDGISYLCINLVEAGYEEAGFHRKRTGLNHIAFRVGKKEQVDNFFEEFLVPDGIKTLYGGPKSYPEYGNGYYAVYFEDPDRIKVEIVYESI